ncbi:methylated-DNA--[protein]-cysteine S-methyltransferase [Parasphaerochaeta coccoides]|uniref:Methylated-DNA--protein-cysteine methyltransferase n=1 Tax=Parasphaerochaeta coccoides (strain ATCC BAA-1237 / DSM 17374 / SPN1) TaxID=760011 RepID=F4GIZ1_PARC1|nr:methylated-DNA--[protein]-cysteine S-methyltransferase [Parasphaerochaeta coccoides]AEC01286.1 methylated-DNA/protein-cysteinemethyltransferase [Parasphaerochaeta coccoides DSM 17374]
MKNIDAQTTVLYDTPLGVIAISERNGAICGLAFEKGRKADSLPERETPLLREAIRQVRQYLSGTLTIFDLPLEENGTLFQKKVWEALRTIPYGQTRSYKDIAIHVGSPLAFRAVGMANNRNPIAIITPCHRVIGAQGDMVGYGGGLDIKVWLLELEKKSVASH